MIEPITTRCWCGELASTGGLCTRHHYAQRVMFHERVAQPRYGWMHEGGEWIVFDRNGRNGWTRVAICDSYEEAQAEAYRLNGYTPQDRAGMHSHAERGEAA